MRLTDFGIAKRLDDIDAAVTAAGMLVGTPHYLAPEQATGQPLSPATDVYQVGLVLDEMLTGQRAPGVEPDEGGGGRTGRPTAASSRRARTCRCRRGAGDPAAIRRGGSTPPMAMMTALSGGGAIGGAVAADPVDDDDDADADDDDVAGDAGATRPPPWSCRRSYIRWAIRSPTGSGATG